MMIRSLGLTLVLVGALGVSAKAQSSYVVTLEQDGNNVVATGSGDFDLTDLTFGGTDNVAALVDPSNNDTIATGISAPADATYGLGEMTIPASLGDGGDTFASSSSGAPVGVNLELYLPSGYVSDTVLSSSATWDNTTLADLGVTPGTYTWSWGSGVDAGTFTLYAGASPVPEPADYGWINVLAMLGFVAWRRFSTRYFAA